MRQPSVQYPKDSTFGKRIRELTREKAKVAEATVERFLASGASVFIGDGSSTFFVGLSMYEKQMPVTTWTNHLAISHEFALWASGSAPPNRMEVFQAGGQVDQDLMMTCGDDAERFTDHWARKAQCIILSVRCLFGDQGPAGMEQKSLSIKRKAVKAALETGAKIVFVADHVKLSQPYANEPLVFLAANDWKDAMENKAVFVVSSRHPVVTEERLVQKPITETEWFQRNRWTLSRTMKKRYIEVSVV